MSDRYYQDIEAVKELYSPDDATAHLKSGAWELLKIVEKQASTATSGGVMVNTTIVYVMGLLKGSERPELAQPKPASQPPSGGKTKTKPCNRCSREIYFEYSDGRWLPKNLDGSQHRCQG